RYGRPTGYYDLRRRTPGWVTPLSPSKLNTGRGWLRDASSLRRHDICPRIRAPTTEFSSGVRLRKSIWTLTDVLPLVTSQRFPSRVMSLADRSRVSILAVGSCPAPGPPSSKILPGIRRPILLIFSPTPKVHSIQ